MKFKGKTVEMELKDRHAIHPYKVTRIWIVVADERIARIFRRERNSLELIGEAFPTRIQRKKGMPDDSMGRVASFGGARHKLEPSAEPGRRDAENFAHDLCVWLEGALNKNSFDRLVLIAAPRTLGDIRQRLKKAVQTRIMAEINKELTKLNEKDLQEELKELLWF